MGVNGTEKRPRRSTSRDDPQSFRVWAERGEGRDWGPKWVCLATFMYLQECLDYISYCHKRGCGVLFQSPTGCEFKPAPQDAAPPVS